MLDSSDREFIRKEIREALNPEEKPNTKKVKDPRKLNINDIVTGIGSSANSLRKTKLGKGAIDALLYSNIITATLANNSDLLKSLAKGTGKVLSSGAKIIKDGIKIKSKNINKKNIPNESLTTSSKNLPKPNEKLISMNSTNYIMAKNAMFIGGKNYININMPLNKMGSFNMPSNGAENIIQSKSNLNLPAGPIIEAQVLKTNKSQLLEAKKTNKLLGVINKRMGLIVGGVLLVGAGIVGVAALIRRLLRIKNNNIDPKNTMTKLNDYQKTNSSDKINNIAKSVNKETKLTQVKTVDKGSDKGQNWWSGRSGKIAKSTAGAPYRAPFDLKVLALQVNSRNIGSLDIKVERNSTKTRKSAVIMNVVNPLVVPGDLVKKGQIIGEVSQNGQIFIKDITDKEFEEYESTINKLSERSQEEKDLEIDQLNQHIDAGQSDKINRAMGAIRFKQLQKDSGKVGTGLTEFVSIDEKDVKNYHGELGHSTESLKNMPMKLEAAPAGPITKLKRNIHNITNKNSELGKSQAIKANPQNPTKVEKPETTVNNKKDKVILNAPKDKVVSHGLYNAMDIAAANSSTYALMHS